MSFLQFAYRNVSRNKRTYAAYFLSSAFSVMIFFVCTLFIFNPGIRGSIMYPIVMQTMITAVCVMYLFLFFFVLYSVGSFLTSRKHEIGIWLMHGMTKKQLHRMIFLENMLIGTGAVVAGIASGLVTGKLFLMIGSHVFGIPSIPFRLTWEALALTTGAFAVLFLIISICTSALFRNLSLIELLQAGRRTKLAPKGSAWLSATAVVLILAAYGFAATTSVSNLYVRMLPVTAMTVVGTHLLYNHAGVWLVERLQRKRGLFWKKTNIVTLSNLSFRLKDHSRILFMVTIVSTVSFCAVGVSASITTLSEQFHNDYPAAVSYLAKDGNPAEGEHLQSIQRELLAKGLHPRMLQFPVKNIPAAPEGSDATPQALSVISFSSYEQAIRMAGIPFREQPLTGHDALSMIGSERDRAYISARPPAAYNVMDGRLLIKEVGYTGHVAVPEHLLRTELREMDGYSSGIVVSDALFARLQSREGTDRYTAFYVDEFRKTFGVASDLAASGEVKFSEGRTFSIAVSGTLYVLQMGAYRAMLFAALLIGTVFFIAAGSFLYFRLYADLDYDRRQYAAMAKLGVTDKELSRIVTRQLALLFFVPIVMAVVHSIFAFIALQSLFYLSIALEMGFVLLCFFSAQVMYFFFIRFHYLRNVRKRLP